MTVVASPVPGRVVGLAAVPDPVFAAGLLGPGTAVDPVREPIDAVAPLTGRVVALHPHAFVVADAEGRGVLTHLGVDTVHLHGAGFQVLIAQGDIVARGRPVIRWNPAAVEAVGASPVTAVVALQAPPGCLAAVAHATRVSSGDQLFTWPGPGPWWP